MVTADGIKQKVFWHDLLPEKKPRSFPVQNGNLVPKTAKVVIIGGGISGISCGYHLLSLGITDVVIFDQRCIGDGATGRNGGHQWGEVAESRDAQASKHQIIEQNDVREVRELINQLTDEKEREAIDLHVTGGLNVSFSQEEEAFMNDFAEHCADVKFYNKEELMQHNMMERKEDCMGGIVYENPGQFVPGNFILVLAKKLKSQGIKIFTQCSVTDIRNNENNDEESFGWLVRYQTEGSTTNSIQCKYVVHATNGYDFSLLPSRLADQVYKVKGQVIAVSVPKNVLQKSLIYQANENSHEEYLIQRKTDNVLIFGGCRERGDNEGIDQDDDTQIEENVSLALMEELQNLFPESHPGMRVTHAWCGILCFTKDKHPIVGQIKELKNQFLSIGFCGHGMVRTFSCGKFVANSIGLKEGNALAQLDPLIGEIFHPDRF